MGNELAKVNAEEKELRGDVSSIEHFATTHIIRTDDDFAIAGELVKKVKAAQKRVDEYWEPMRQSTYKAYKAVTDHKKEMTDPLKKAEQILKKKMGDYQAEKERRRAEQEAKLRELARLEAERKMAEAEEAAKAGDEFAADYAFTEAQALAEVAETTHVAKKVAKVDGIAQKKAWEITGIDLSELPTDFAGVLIRPADMGAIMRLIKASGGTIRIPGVQYKETVNFAVKVS